MTPKTFFKILPLMLLALVAFGCGGSGGTAEPQPIGDGVMEAIASESFTKVYDYLPDWQKDSDVKQTEVKMWRMKEGWDRWKDLKPRFEGDNGLDPKDKSGITGSEEKWTAASNAERAAVLMGFYKAYAADDFEKRLKDGKWYLADREVRLAIEGQGSAEFRYVNCYKDSIEVKCFREGGLWYLSDVKLNMEKKLPEKPKD